MFHGKPEANMKMMIALIAILLMGLLSRGTRAAQSGYWLAFQSNRDGSDDIFIMDASGNGVRNLTANTAADRHPDWSADGLRITFASDRGGNNDIYAMDNNGEHIRNLTNNSANDNSPDWSPDGGRIVFISDRDGGFDVYTLEVTTLAVTRLTTDGERKSAPTWSPDGNAIAFWAGAEVAEQIVTLDLETNERTIVTQGTPASWPTWSPDGARITYSQISGDGASDILASDVTTGGIVNLTQNAASDVRPAYASNAQIAFASDRDGNLEIYVMGAEGASPQRLTFNTAEDSSPAWQPIPAVILPTEASAVVVLNGLQLSSGSDLSGNRYASEGQGRLFAPTEPVTLDDLIVIRLEIEPAPPDANPTPTSQSGSDPTSQPIITRPVDVYEILGAELMGVDLERFRIEPNPTDYVLRLDLNDVNYWEWTLRARDANTIGVNYLGARVYAPQVQPDGSIAELEVFNYRFTVEVIAAATVAPAASPTPEPPPLPDGGDVPSSAFAIAINADESITLISLGNADLSDLTLAGAGYPYGEFVLLTDFPALAALEWESGLCVIYVREDTDYRPSRQCDPARLYEHTLPAFDIFWYDDDFNAPRDIVVRFAERTFVCFSARSACEFP